MRPTLRLGSRGPDVAELQRLLTDDNVSPGPVDGAFGPATEAAVRVFQKRRGLAVDGICGPLTWAALLGPQKQSAPDSTRGALSASPSNGANAGAPTAVVGAGEIETYGSAIAQSSRVALSPLPTGITWGVDVSSAGQPRPLPWRSLYEAGARFAWVRVTVGLTVDGWAVQHAADARAAGLLVGGYGVPRARAGREAWNEGNHCAIEASRVGAVDLPLWLDLELPDVAHLAHASAAEILTVLSAAADWCEGAEAALGRLCGVYTGPAWLATARQRAGEDAGRAALVRLAGLGAERPLSLARYPLRPVREGEWPAAPWPWREVTTWQVSGNVGATALRVDGWRVDLDLFRGGVEELRALGR